MQTEPINKITNEQKEQAYVIGIEEGVEGPQNPRANKQTNKK